MATQHDPVIVASMFKNRRATLERIEKFISPLYFVDVNLRGRLYPETVDVTDVQIYNSTTNTHQDMWDDYQKSFTDAMAAEFTPIQIGDSFGPAWSTHWFKLCSVLPKSWVGKQIVLLWNSGCEATVWKTYTDPDTGEVNGHPVQGLNEVREMYIISECLGCSELQQSIYLEVSCLALFGNSSGGLITPPDPDRTYNVKKAQIAVRDLKVYNLLMDLDVIYNMAKSLPDTDSRSYDALYTANHMVNLLVNHTTEGYNTARRVGEKFLTQRNGDVQHTVHAIGHCHIDTAWLWRVKDSVRKVVRSWTSQMRLAEKYPNFKFACSQTVQHEWMKEFYPVVFDEMKRKVEGGSFLPVGGTFVEMDGNIPDGESLIRQFLHGQKFYKENYGERSKVFWLPDTFGYTAQLPQIMADAGMNWFVTQKLSWNLVNKFPHNSFLWEGLDGTTVLTHFPPADSYSSEVTVEDLMKIVSNQREKGRVSDSMLLYGHGDGGGGPTEDMVERAIRLEDVSGCPKVTFSTPNKFFEKLEDSRQNLCRWVGELYLELHQGTFTSQRRLKDQNSYSQRLLRRCDFIDSVWLILKGRKAYSEDGVKMFCKTMMLNQFHDILPGSCIEDVKKDASESTSTSIRGLVMEGCDVDSKENQYFVNCLSVPKHSKFYNPPGRVLLPPLSLTAREGLVDNCSEHPELSHTVTSAGEGEGSIVEFENRYLKVTLDQCGRLSSVLHKESGTETIPRGCYGNLFVIYDDVPLYWDAWDVMDYHLETRSEVNHLTTHRVTTTPDSISVQFTLKINPQDVFDPAAAPFIRCHVTLSADNPYLLFSMTVGWRGMAHKFLKVEFPVTVRAPAATYGVPFGFIQRPTHYNTSWDSAKYEVCTHGWFDVSQHDWGVALLTGDTHGAAVHGHMMRLSLVRSPKQPDPHCDMGDIYLTYALQPHTGTFQSAGVIETSQLIHSTNHWYNDEIALPGCVEAQLLGRPLIVIDNPAVALATVKPAEEGRAVVIRVYESYGSRARCNISSILPLVDVVQCNILEDKITSKPGVEITKPWTPSLDGPGGSIEVCLQPFRILSLLAYY